jgi:hypothetical protein
MFMSVGRVTGWQSWERDQPQATALLQALKPESVAAIAADKRQKIQSKHFQCL